MMDTLIIEKDKIGGQVTTTSEIVNYPAIRHTTGPELMEEMRIQAQDFGVAFTNDEIIDVDFSQTIKTVQSASQTYQAYAGIDCDRASARKIGFLVKVNLQDAARPIVLLVMGSFSKA